MAEKRPLASTFDSDRDSELSTIDEALADLRAGRVIIVLDDEDRENEGDMVFAADAVTPESINFLATHARGLICVPMTESRLRELELGPMVTRNTAHMQTGFTVSVDSVHGTTTGISAADRAATVRALVDPKTVPADLARPGHVFPLVAERGGVLVRPGHTEAVVDLSRLAGLSPAGVLCEITNRDGAMARLPELKALGRDLGLKLITIRDLILYRLRHDRLVEHAVATTLPTRFGVFDLHAFDDALSGDVHVALTMGDVSEGAPVLTRVHSQCLTGDVFHSTRCDCGEQLEFAMAAIAKEGRGVVVYLPQEGRGIGLRNKLRSYQLQDDGLDTVEANVKLGFRPDERTYVAGGQILRALGVRRVRLLTNNPAKSSELERVGIDVTERIPVHMTPTDANRRYLNTKRDKLGHLLPREHDEHVGAAPSSSPERGGSRT